MKILPIALMAAAIIALHIHPVGAATLTLETGKSLSLSPGAT